MFLLFFYIWTAVVLVLFSPSYINFKLCMKASQAWAAGVVWGLKHIAGVESKLIGIENLEKLTGNKYSFEGGRLKNLSTINHQPSTNKGFIVACKHQSAWETIVPFLYVPNTSYVYKKEIGYIPFFGWYNVFLNNISVDRKAGAKALKIVTSQAIARVSEGRGITLFPEGTRVPVDKKVKYKPAIYSIYKEGVDVIPAAVNSGYFWPKGKFLNKKGTIYFEYLEPMPKGLSKEDFMAELENRIETASQKLANISNG
ncbi:MAG: lysophospholipid acyltransferase family protein [Rickettsiales bacterium]|nr:lysophospholipid acyltransferase family protein [Rickettsiales bacterium]